MVQTVIGGSKLKAFIRQAKAAQAGSVKDVEIGFFASAKYPDGTPIAAVAAWNEYGTERNGQQHVPERPFFRNAIRGAPDELLEVIKEKIDPRTMAFDEKVAGAVGQVMVGRVQKSITTLRDPPNAPSTIAGKGSSNPLINNGDMRKAATYRVNK